MVGHIQATMVPCLACSDLLRLAFFALSKKQFLHHELQECWTTWTSGNLPGIADQSKTNACACICTPTYICMYIVHTYMHMSTYIYRGVPYIYMGASSFPHPYISASSVVRPIQYSAKDVLTLVMPHTAKCGINPYISIHMTEIRHIHGPDCIKYEHV